MSIMALVSKTVREALVLEGSSMEKSSVSDAARPERKRLRRFPNRSPWRVSVP